MMWLHILSTILSAISFHMQQILANMWRFKKLQKKKSISDVLLMNKVFSTNFPQMSHRSSSKNSFILCAWNYSWIYIAMFIQFYTKGKGEKMLNTRRKCEMGIYNFVRLQTISIYTSFSFHTFLIFI